jgi:hypothetical protein
MSFFELTSKSRNAVWNNETRLALCRFIALSIYRFIALSLYRFIALSLCRFVALSLCRRGA